jgi:hypothetical protein
MLAALFGAVVLAAPVQGADLTASLKKGTPDLKSASSLAFGPDGILFVGDPQGAAVFAVATGDTKQAAAPGPINIQGIDGKIASLLGTTPKAIAIRSITVNNASGNVYLAVARGTGSDAAAVLMRVEPSGRIAEFPLKDVPFSKAVLPNPATGTGRNSRMNSITKVAFVKDRVIVSGLSNEEWASNLRAIPFPFTETDKGASIQIFHGAHGKFETNAPVKTFAPYDIGGEAHLLAAYQCTPLVKLPVSQLKAGEKVKATTVAELGNMNSPLDMIIYEKNGKDYILMANNNRGVMKITTENVAKIKPIEQPIRGGGVAGLTYDKMTNLAGVEHLDRLDKDHALLLVRKDTGLNLETIDLP